MKVAFVCPDGHSILLFCKGILKALRDAVEAEVSVLCSPGRYQKDIEALGVACIPVECYRFLSPVKDAQYLIALFRTFRREQFDLVIAFSTKPNIYATVAARLAGVRRVVVHVVGLGSAFSQTSNLKGRCMRFMFLQLYHLAFRLCSKAWFTNGNDLRYFLDLKMMSKSKAVLTRNYLNIDRFAPDSIDRDKISELKRELRIGDGERVVVMVARMIWQKGIREFAEAAELLKAEYPHIRFLLIAPLETGSPGAVPEDYIIEKEKTANLKWLGFREDLKNIYAMSDLAVLPSYYKEGGYPLGLLEPMALGKPVISSDSIDCCGPVEDGKNGFIVPARNSKALATAIASIFQDEKKRVSFGNYSRMKIEKEFDERDVIREAFDKLGLLDLPLLSSTCL